MNFLDQRTLLCLSPCISCGNFFIRDWTILRHLFGILHIVDSEAPLPQILRTSLMLIVLFDAVRKNDNFAVIQLARLSTTFFRTIFLSVTQRINISPPGSLDDIRNLLHCVTGC
uniref:C2H2-type domain-containing protein n=1 Tax=Heterorhabditis bacteriophora TaxID=37862 RepID=A0A1I7WV77_HETBA